MSSELGNGYVVKHKLETRSFHSSSTLWRKEVFGGMSLASFNNLVKENDINTRNYIDSTQSLISSYQMKICSLESEIAILRKETQSDTTHRISDQVATGQIIEATEQTVDAENASIRLYASQLKESQHQLLVKSSRLNVCGALEDITRRIACPQEENVAPLNDDKPDAVMQKLLSNQQFNKTLMKIVNRKKVSSTNIPKIINSIWDTVQKHNHDQDDDIIIKSEEYSVEECVVLVAIFDHYSIPYLYMEGGQIVDFFD